MSIDEFLAVVWSVTTPPVGFFAKRLEKAIRNAGVGVHETFFPTKPTARYLTWQAGTHRPACRELSTTYVSFALSKTTDHGFARTMNGTVTAGLIEDWFTRHSSTVGTALFVDYMNHKGRLKRYFDASETWAPKIARHIGRTDFLTEILVQCDVVGSSLPAKALLLMIDVLDDGGEAFTAVRDAWQANEQWHRVDGFDAYGWLDNTGGRFVVDSPIFQGVSEAVSAACAREDVTHFSKAVTVPTVSGVASAIKHYATTTYGAEVARWVSSAGGPKHYGLTSGQGPNNTETECTDHVGCIARGTPIRLADGTSKPVDEVREGDLILSAHGHVSVSSSELIVNPAVRRFYGINGTEPFMSHEHAVMTQRGWCSLAPWSTRKINPHLEVGLLRPGDVVWKWVHGRPGAVEYEKEVVRRITRKTVEPGQCVGYDLHFREGYPSYHAHDYCCLLNYPEMTGQRIAINVLSNMSPGERQRFSHGLDHMAPLLRKALGGFVMDHITEALAEPKAAARRPRHTHRHGTRRPFVQKTSDHILPTLSVRSCTGQDAAPSGLESIALVGGHLFIDREPVMTHTEDGHVFWQRRRPDGQDEVGALELDPHGLTGRGVIQVGDDTDTFAVDGLVAYSTTYVDDGQSMPWFDFEMGFEPDEQGDAHAVGKLVDPNGDPAAQARLDEYTTVVITLDTVDDSLTVLRAEIGFAPDFCALGGSRFIAAEFDFTLDYRSFSGTLHTYDISRPDWRGAAHQLTGRCRDTKAMNASLARLTELHLRAPVTRTAPHGTTSAPTLSHGLRQALRLRTAVPKSVNDLFTLPTPDLENVHQEAFSKLKTLMLHTIDDDWRGWFGEAAPTVGPAGDLTRAQADLSKDPVIEDFLKNAFAVGYLTQAFSQSAEDKIRSKFDAVADVPEKLDFFWKGTQADNCFGALEGYSLAASKLTDSVYAENVPGLQRYLADHPRRWARRLYDYCTTPVTLNGLALQNTLDGRARLTHLSSVLHALDPKKRDRVGGVSYATALWNQVMDRRLKYIIEYSSTGDADDTAEFLTEFLRQYFASLVAGDDWKDEILATARRDIDEMMAEFGVDDTNALVEAQGDIIADAVAVLIDARDLPLPARINSWAERNPKVSSGLGTALSVGVYSYAIYSSIHAFLGWSDLKPEEKVQAVTSVLDTACSIFSDLATWQSARSLATATTTIDELMQAGTGIRNAVEAEGLFQLADRLSVQVEFQLAELDSPALAEAGRAAGEALAEAGELEAVSTRWTTISKVGGAFARGMSVLALGAACVCTGLQIANDFATGQPAVVKALDILTEVATGVAFIVEAGSGIAALAGIEVCSTIPVIGVAAAVVGIVASVVMLFIHRTPPPTPEEEFVDAHSIPFVTALAPPGAEWLASQQKISDHLDDSGTANARPLPAT